MNTNELSALLETKLKERLEKEKFTTPDKMRMLKEAKAPGYHVIYRDKAFDKTYRAQIPPGISKAEIVKMLKRTIRVGLEVISIKPMKEQFKLDKEKFTKPDQMRMHEEVFDIFGYETKDFDICPGAVSLYKGIVAGDHTDGTPSPEMQEVIVKSAKLHDILFKLEKDVLENGGTEEDIAKAQRIADAIMKIADKLDLTGEHNYVQGHIDIITKKVKGEVEEAAPGYKHDCASKVVHETYGEGTCIPEQHNLVKEGKKWVVTEYDVEFDSGKVVRNVPVNELKIVSESNHGHKRRKKKNEANVNEDRYGHPITAQGNQAYIQVNKLLRMLSGREKRDAEKAFNKMWPLIKSAMEAEESK